MNAEEKMNHEINKMKILINAPKEENNIDELKEQFDKVWSSCNDYIKSENLEELEKLFTTLPGATYGVNLNKLVGTNFTISDASIKAATGYLKNCRNAKDVNEETLVKSILYLAFAFGNDKKDPNGLEK